MTSSEKPEPQGSGPSSTECRLFKANGRHCLTHPYGGHNTDGTCCVCGVTREQLAAPKKPDLRCRCGHYRVAHPGQGACGAYWDACDCKSFACDHTQCGWKPRGEPPKTVLFEKYEEAKPRPCTCGPNEACGDPCTPAPELKCVCGHAKSSHDSTPCCIGNRNLCGCLDYRPWTDGPEPPLTPEEEEEAPEDSRCVFCWHSESQHNLLAQTCTVNGEASRCGCERFRTEPEGADKPICGHCYTDHAQGGCEPAEAPPQPERRAPYVATYSVGGHLYEVAVPGDACLQAVDGALVIRHGLGPVAGLVGFQPLTVEEKR